MKKIKYLFLLFIGLISVCFKLNGQTSLRFESLGQEDGLSQTSFYDLFIDSYGFVWVATQDGLNKYDGYRVTVYRNDPSNPKTICNKRVLALAEAEPGIIWVGTRKGLSRFNSLTEEAEHFFSLPGDTNSIISNNISSLWVDKNGLIWIGSPEGLCVLDYASKKIERFYHKPSDTKSISSNTIRCITGNSKNQVLIGTANGLNVFDPVKKTFTSFFELPDKNITCIFSDSQDNLWVGTSKGLGWFSPEQKTYTCFIADSLNKTAVSFNVINGIAEDKQGRIWITTGNGLNIFDKTKKEFEKHFKITGDEYGIFSNNVGKIEIGKDGLVWITSGRYIQKHNPDKNRFLHYYNNPENANSISGNQVWGIQEDENGILWIATDGRGLNSFDRKKNKWTKYIHNPADPNSIAGNNIWHVYTGRNEKIWITTGVSLDCMDKKNGAFTHYFPDNSRPNGLSGNTSIREVLEDRNGFVWVATSGGLNKLDPKTNLISEFSHVANDKSSITSNNLSCITESKDGKLWLGTFGSGLNLFDPLSGKNKRYENILGDTNTMQASVYCIYEDKNDKVWIGGDDGITLLDPVTDKIKHIREKDGLPNETIYGIMEDNSGNLWISSNKGIVMFNPVKNQYKYFNKNDGIQSNEFNGYSYYQSSLTGEMFFGGINGLTIFHPDSIRDNSYQPAIFIHRIRYFDKENKTEIAKEEPASGDKEIILSYKNNQIEVEFLSLSLSKPDQNKYAYRLIGLSDQWNQLGTKREITLTGLPPGKYTLQVKGSNGDGVWNDTPATLTIIILPPWWKTWWAYSLYAIILLAGISAFIRYRSRRLKTANLKLEHKVAARTKELSESLESLKATQKQLVQQEKMASLGEMTAGIAHEIQNPLNFVNNFSEVNKDLLNEMKEEIDKGNFNEVKVIANDVISNEEKITFHGKRADGIVKNMLQHSRSSSGQKELTDINALCDEYVRLSYHGLRAKDKSFNAKFETDFDETVGKLNVIPQDIGRVVLNLINNAFYAVSERKKLNEPGYEPTVSVSTIKDGDSIKIKVSDNGTGIPQKVLDKIFQPFFTTKPTGQGTGLGLSLSYDIVKAHGGELKVETKEREGTEFSILLPV